MNVDATLAVINGIAAAASPDLAFRFVPAEDESVDSEFELLRDGKPLRMPSDEPDATTEGFSIQVCAFGEGFASNRYYFDASGQLYAMQDIYHGNNIRRAATLICERIR